MGLVNSLIEGIPLYYLGVLCILDIHQNLHLKIFFCSIVERIHKNRESIRKGICRNYGVHEDPCPVFSIIKKNEANFLELCPKIFMNQKECVGAPVFWGIVMDGINMFHQATFLEIIAIQFVILAAVTESKVVSIISLCLGLALLIIGIGIYTYSLKIKSPIFLNSWVRLFIVIGVLIMFLAFTSMNNIKDIDGYLTNLISQFGLNL
jgi:hypothetical protein